MRGLWNSLYQMTRWWPDRWEAPERDFLGHRDIVTRSLSRYHFVAPNVHGVVLEIGCGRGYGFEVLTMKSTRQIGIDINREFLYKARDQFPPVSFACASGHELPFRDHSFDSIIAFEVIEHIADDLSFLGELKRVARNSAFIAISTPNILLASGTSAKPLDPFHRREYRASDFDRLLNQIFSSVNLFGQHERADNQISTNNFIDRIPIRWKYFFPHHVQSLLSVALRPALRLEDCRFQNENLENSHTFVALCRP
jgi:SAM-dependent methyltransferase